MSDRSIVWPVVKFVLVVTTIAACWHLTPAWVFDIPFVWMIPVFSPAGFVLIFLELAEALSVHRRGPESAEEAWQAATGAALLVVLGTLILKPVAVVWNAIRNPPDLSDTA